MYIYTSFHLNQTKFDFIVLIFLLSLNIYQFHKYLHIIYVSISGFTKHKLSGETYKLFTSTSLIGQLISPQFCFSFSISIFFLCILFLFNYLRREINSHVAFVYIHALMRICK